MKLRQVLGILMLGLGMIVGVPTAQATDTTALSTMPKGVSLDGIFGIPSLSGLSNSAQVVNSTNSTSSGTQGVQITDSTKQVGATWSTDDNKIDLSKNFKASMWMYFGNRGSNAGDGMAFVLQNSGASAITSGLSSTTAPGQTLGVWGLDNDASADNSTIAGKAIQNSWAVEFDEYVNANTVGGQNSSFDNIKLLTGPHLASTYPGDSRSYVQHQATSNGKYYYTLSHNGTILTTLSDGGWHHLTLQWTAPTSGTTGTMTYTINDKNASTGVATTGSSQSVSVDVTKLGLTASTIATTPVWWGFTGSTGELYANNMVVFESIPGLVDADAALTVTDTTQDKAVTDGSTVNGNDGLSYKYDLKYNGGKVNWKAIQASLDQNQNVTFSSGKIAYADGSTEDLSASEVSNTTTIAHTLAKDLGTTNNAATLTLTGKAANVTATTSIASVTQYFNGNNYLTSVATPAFTIQPSRNLTLSMDSGNATTVDPNGTINLAGKLTTTGSFANSDMTIHTTLDNGNTIDNFTMNGTSSDASANGAFNLALPASKLTTGSNKVSFYVTDSNGNKSNVVSTTINLTGELSFGTIGQAISFGSNEISAKEVLLPATSAWTVDVNDMRASGAKWYVYATASALASDQHTLAGGIVYVDANGNQTSMTNSATMVASGDSGSSDTHHIGSDWTNNQGIFLDVQPSTYAGTYSGTIDWSLANVPSN
ncbi:lectin-like domain-containing protein [Lactiplantibacillus pingfangensis]|uniref:lectin-like domain-containing protein n=1 Tax=Lactiplantibacillus pingfangensis TaxID=2559915 RepID=UPI0010F7F06E|nr:hypothetical protein [Lactiplantibacillus pingfangensis]